MGWRIFFRETRVAAGARRVPRRTIVASSGLAVEELVHPNLEASTSR
jgi:hypothetical protein